MMYRDWNFLSARESDRSLLSLQKYVHTYTDWLALPTISHCIVMHLPATTPKILGPKFPLPTHPDLSARSQPFQKPGLGTTAVDRVAIYDASDHNRDPSIKPNLAPSPQ